jgi:hypothetical protein
MSYQLLSETTPVARKQYSCMWCVERIKIGEKHVHEVSKYDGEFQDHRWHPECLDVCREYILESGEDTFEAHECKRGSQEHA